MRTLTVVIQRPLLVMGLLAVAVVVLSYLQPANAYAYYLLVLGGTLFLTAAGKREAKRRWSGWPEVVLIASTFMPPLAGITESFVVMLGSAVVYILALAWYLRARSL